MQVFEMCLSTFYAKFTMCLVGILATDTQSVTTDILKKARHHLSCTYLVNGVIYNTSHFDIHVEIVNFFSCHRPYLPGSIVSLSYVPNAAYTSKCIYVLM